MLYIIYIVIGFVSKEERKPSIISCVKKCVCKSPKECSSVFIGR